MCALEPPDHDGASVDCDIVIARVLVDSSQPNIPVRLAKLKSEPIVLSKDTLVGEYYEIKEVIDTKNFEESEVLLAHSGICRAVLNGYRHALQTPIAKKITPVGGFSSEIELQRWPPELHLSSDLAVSGNDQDLYSLRGSI